MGALAVEFHPRLQVPEAARVEDTVRRLEHDRKLNSFEHAARENGGKRALLEWNLLTREKRVPRREPRPRELEHHRNTALHVASA